jgi:hypothetical protein
VTATNAAASDIGQMPHLLHGEERVLYGDQAYWKEADRRRSRRRASATGSTGARRVAIAT